MYDLSIKHQEIALSNKKILWFWDELNTNANQFLINNLVVCDEDDNEIWNMRDIQMFDDVCTKLHVDETSFYIYTFSGCQITIDIETLCVINKKLIK